jgi:hypothetical protein
MTPKTPAPQGDDAVPDFIVCSCGCVLTFSCGHWRLVTDAEMADLRFEAVMVQSTRQAA